MGEDRLEKKEVGLYLSTRLHVVIYRHINLLSFLFFFFLPSFLSKICIINFSNSFYGGLEELPHSEKTKTTHVLLTRPITPVLPASHEQQTQLFVGHSVGFFFSHGFPCAHVFTRTTQPGG